MPLFVGFVPTHPLHVDAFFELAPVTSSDVVYDLGSGDGRLVFGALENGAGKAVGFELDDALVRRCSNKARRKGLGSQAVFVRADVTEADLRDATVIYCYLAPQASQELQSKFERELRPGCRVVMESFPITAWEPARVVSRGYADYYETNEFYLYVMPPHPAWIRGVDSPGR